jgi:hypothetical protein
MPAVSLPPVFTLVSCFAYYSNLKMEAAHSSENSIDFQRTKRYYIPEDRTVHNHRCENLKFYMDNVMLVYEWTIATSLLRIACTECWYYYSLFFFSLFFLPVFLFPFLPLYFSFFILRVPLQKHLHCSLRNNFCFSWSLVTFEVSWFLCSFTWCFYDLRNTILCHGYCKLCEGYLLNVTVAMLILWGKETYLDLKACI